MARVLVSTSVSSSPIGALTLYTGFYEPLRTALNRVFGLDASVQNPFTSVAAGAGSGAIGGELPALRSP